jgi:hypothetical protein
MSLIGMNPRVPKGAADGSLRQTLCHSLRASPAAHAGRHFSTVEVTDTVSAINYNKRIIIFTAANGQTRKIFVDPTVPGLEQIQVGD